jgi:hypothetical protein
MMKTPPVAQVAKSEFNCPTAGRIELHRNLGHVVKRIMRDDIMATG